MAVEFTDSFDRANASTIEADNGWKLATAGSPVPGVIGITGFSAANKDTSAGIAYQETTVPETRDVFVRAILTGGEQTAAANTYYVAIGTMAQRGTVGYGVGARLDFGNSSAATNRILHVISSTGSAIGSYTSLANADVTTSTEKAGGSTDLTVPQQLTFGVSVVRAGLRLRAWYNEDDIDEPDVDFTFRQDYPTSYPIATQTADFGDWWFAFGTSTAADKFRIQQFNALDSFEALAAQAGIQTGASYTLSEIRTRVENRFSRTSNSNLNSTVLNEHINDAVDEILDEGVDIFTFMEPEADIELSPDENGFMTLPYYMDSILRVWNKDQRRPSTFQEWARTDDDRIIARFNRRIDPNTFNAKVQYRLRHERMVADTDVCPIPKNYSEIVVLGALYRLERDDSVRRQYVEFFMKRLRDMKRKENRRRQTRMRVFRTTRQSNRARGQLVPWGTTGL